MARTGRTRLRIGILKADTVSPELRSAHGDYPDMFRELLVGPAQGLELEDIDAVAGALPDPDHCDGYLITGSRHSVYDDLSWIAPLARFVHGAMAAGRRVVGICFGHQLIGQCFGGEVRPTGWCVGVHEARVTEHACWMQPPKQRLRLLVSHQDQVVRLPPRARPFLTGDTCAQGGFVLRAEAGPGAALTFQGHPEFTPAYAEALMDSREAALGSDVHGAGKASLREPTDHRVVATWMLRFLRGGA